MNTGNNEAVPFMSFPHIALLSPSSQVKLVLADIILELIIFKKQSAASIYNCFHSASLVSFNSMLLKFF